MSIVSVTAVVAINLNKRIDFGSSYFLFARQEISSPIMTALTIPKKIFESVVKYLKIEKCGVKVITEGFVINL